MANIKEITEIKEILINGKPLSLNGPNLKTYICGITPYNDSHVGHARTYVTFDIIRKILFRYFGKEMEVVMNVTDIDDKIINAAHEQNVPFQQISEYYTKLFFDLMNDLGVDPPNIITKVTDYVDESIAFIQKLIDNGYAYKSNGSVYFDLEAYSKKYSGDPFELNCINVDENELDVDADNFKSCFSHEKRNKKDVSLWKAQKYDWEPSWNNPFSDIKGRLSWSLECAAMCTSIFDDKLDLHFGGIDLKFPHHTCEVLQVTAYYNKDIKNKSELDTWVEHFMHLGHLNINGLKMSKSLKNFITVKDMLKVYTPNQIRLWFLQHDWNKTIDYSEENLKHAINLEKTLKEFIGFIGYVERESQKYISLNKWNKQNHEQKLEQILTSSKTEIDNFLKNNFDTSSSLISLQKLMTATYTYVNSIGDMKNIQHGLISGIHTYLKHILYVFDINIDTNESNESNNKLTDTLVEFRDTIRNTSFAVPSKKALAEKTNEELINMLIDTKKLLLESSDKVRSSLTEFGVKIEDKGQGKPSIWKKI